MRISVAPPMPRMIAGRCWRAGRPATAMATTTALSPASVMSTSAPQEASRWAAARPAIPPPATTTWGRRPVIGVASASRRRLACRHLLKDDVCEGAHHERVAVG